MGRIVEGQRGGLSWPPTREELAAEFAAGRTLAAIGRRHGRSAASVSQLAARYGLATARAAGRLPARSRPRAAGERARPPTDAALAELAQAGIGDVRAAALFAVHPSTYRAWRRRLRDRQGCAEDRDGPLVDAAEFGFDPSARWPAAARFADDERALRPVPGGRLPRPITIVEGASSLALLSV